MQVVFWGFTSWRWVFEASMLADFNCWWPLPPLLVRQSTAGYAMQSTVDGQVQRISGRHPDGESVRSYRSYRSASGEVRASSGDHDFGVKRCEKNRVRFWATEHLESFESDTEVTLPHGHWNASRGWPMAKFTGQVGSSIP